MENFINISILIPLFPLVTALFVFALLASFTRTINRLTKPVSALIVFSLLISGLISSFYYFKKIEGELVLSKYLEILNGTNLVIHINLISERILIIFSLITAIIIVLCFNKLPRREGYVSLMISIGIISSTVMLLIMLIDFSAIT